MVARFAGAGLGLLAFTITTAAGLLVRNPVEVTLSRSILALFFFCIIGLVVGTAAQMVIAEHEKKRQSEIRKRYDNDSAGTDDGDPRNGSPNNEGQSIGIVEQHARARKEQV